MMQRAQVSPAGSGRLHAASSMPTRLALQTMVLRRAATSSLSPRSRCRAARRLLMYSGTIDQAKAEGIIGRQTT